ncbi:hypothetical protein Tco_1290931, partial [Tanacetum coccineum]
MAISSLSSSSSSDNKVQNCSKQCLESFKTLQKNFDSEREKHNITKLEIQGYEIALESLESRILGHEKNELAWGEKYEFQNYELKCRETKINNLNMELEKVVKERDELKDKIAKWEESTMNLDEILNKSTPANDMSSKENEYHVVPPPITVNFLTPRADISFAGKTNDANTEKPKSASESVVSNPKINRDKVIIEDWNSDDEEEEYEVQTVRLETQIVKTREEKSGQNSKKQGVGFRKVNACFVCKSTDHLIKDCLHRPSVSIASLSVSTARPSVSTARPVSIARPSVSTTRPVSTTMHVYATRPFYLKMDNVRPKLAFRPKDLKQDVKTFGVQNMTTVGSRAIVNTGKGKLKVSDLKKSRWVWRPKGNYLDHVSKDIGSFMLKKVEY